MRRTEICPIEMQCVTARMEKICLEKNADDIDKFRTLYDGTDNTFLEKNSYGLMRDRSVSLFLSNHGVECSYGRQQFYRILV